jgi:hypothetical protein
LELMVKFSSADASTTTCHSTWSSASQINSHHDHLFLSDSF